MSESTQHPSIFKKLSAHWLLWWRSQSPLHQDRLALFAPLTAVVLFLAAIFAAFTYLRYEEIEREQEIVRSDVEYTQQRVRLRVLERQEQSMQIAGELYKGNIGPEELRSLSNGIIKNFPEVTTIAWISTDLKLQMSTVSPNIDGYMQPKVGDTLKNPISIYTFNLAKDLHQSVYSQPINAKEKNNPQNSTGNSSNTGNIGTNGNSSNSANNNDLIQLFIPLYKKGQFTGALMTEFDVEGLLRYSVPTEVNSRNAITIVQADGKFVAGREPSIQRSILPPMPWSSPPYETTVPLSPFGNSLYIKAVNYKTSQGMIGNGLIRLVAALSILTAWMLIGTWRHTQKRVKAQEALMSETNFRRAMENSMLTGMRAMDMKGKITYVNAAFCQMTGWSEQELVGGSPPFPYWPKEYASSLAIMLRNELLGLTPGGGYQVKVQHRSGRIFDARLYVSPLVDAYGVQTGWMTSMTDITEPNRIRDQLSAAHLRFTTVLEALDASVSVTPLGSAELLFTNKLYRLWFNNESEGHLSMVQRAGMPKNQSDKGSDEVDNLAGFPSEGLSDASSEHAEIFVASLGKWLEVRARYLNWVDGRLAQMVIATDITARHQAREQAQLQEERAQASSRLITMGEMASSVAHELNQPLTAITNYCKGMMSRINDHRIVESELLIALEKTANQAQRAGQIIQRIKNFVKRSEPNQVISDVITTTMEAIELAEIELKRRRVRFTHYFGPRLPLIKVDRILIQQVLINLLKNAAESIDHAERENAHRNVELNVNLVEVEGQQVVEFAVKDTGGGLAPQVLEHLFEAFFSTKSEGLGIGLNLCRSIVESHQGRMKAENLYNGPDIVGCCFSFWLPAMETRIVSDENLSIESRSYS